MIMKINASVVKDGKWVDFTIKERDNDNDLTDRDIVMYSDSSLDIVFYINEDGLLSVKLVDVNENLHVIPICYAEGVFER